MMRFLIALKLTVGLLFFAIFPVIQPVFAADSKLVILSTGNETRKDTGDSKQNAASDRPTGEASKTIVVTLTDAQARKLIDALAGQSTTEGIAEPEKKVGGLANFIKKIQSLSNALQQRIHILKSGVGADPEDMPHLYRLLTKSERQEKPDPFKTIFGVIALFAMGLLILWLFRRSTAAAYRRIEGAASADWKANIGGLALRALLDFTSMFIFTVAVLSIYFIFMKRSGPQNVLAASYLTAFLIVMVVQLVSRFFLAPKVPTLRFLPVDDESARYLHQWIMAITAIGIFGLLTCGIFRVAGVSEANHLMMVAVLQLIIISMIFIMILQKKEHVKQVLGKNLPETGLRALIARIWHYLAIGALLLLWFLSAANLLLFGVRSSVPGIQTLLIIPLYFLLDWGMRQILRVVFGIAAKPEAVIDDEAFEALDDAGSNVDDFRGEAVSGIGTETVDKDVDSESKSFETQEAPAKKHIDLHRLNRIIGSSLRIALAAFVFFYLLGMWGIEISIGKAVTRAVFHILIAVLICYVTWEVISVAIQRRMAKEVVDDGEDKEEGGSGGSRVGTLLLLLRKFILTVLITMAVLIILSSIGVNIGPLIAGAGVIGLAIGFGAQTLVKDIISGLFFLMDDAFRVGDYIETAGTKGMVEHISLRSLRLRHPRGMVNTIPFGDMGIVTNMSRDYIITKLDFRVRYDTDVEKVRKIIKKKVYDPIMKDEKLAPKLLDKIKSQGVRELDDSAMIMRVKYKTPPGEQFVIRKEVYRLMQEAFAEAGIEFAHRNVTVFVPEGTEKTASGEKQVEGAGTPGISDKKLIETAGAAAIVATAQADEDKK